MTVCAAHLRNERDKCAASDCVTIDNLISWVLYSVSFCCRRKYPLDERCTLHMENRKLCEYMCTTFKINVWDEFCVLCLLIVFSLFRQLNSRWFNFITIVLLMHHVIVTVSLTFDVSLLWADTQVTSHICKCWPSSASDSHTRKLVTHDCTRSVNYPTHNQMNGFM